ncbi:MAG: hypothetical protein HC802_20680 [Caldilineaceae bacterium]|nr:hypothetical protein [Caldilineaceae bacterium]
MAGTHDVWEVNHDAGYALALLTPDEAARLRADGYPVEMAQEQSALTEMTTVRSTDAGGIGGFPCYRTVAESYADMATLAATHPTLAAWVDFGDSWDKNQAGGPAGNDLRALVLTNQARSGEKFRFLLIAAIHARELATAELAARFAEQLLAGYGQDPDLTWLLDFGEIHIVPIMNPDGRLFAEQGLSWRKNTNNSDGCFLDNPAFTGYGVDLNRNSSFKWALCETGNCSSTDACATTFRGRAAASEPETQAIQTYARALFDDQRGPEDEAAAPGETSGVFISLHSYGKLILYPWGWQAAPSPNGAQMETLAQKFGYFTNYTVCQAGASGCLYQTDGTTDDWTYGELGVASFTFEIGTTFFQSCSYFEQSILEQNSDALLYAAKAARRPYQTPAGLKSSILSWRARLSPPARWSH